MVLPYDDAPERRRKGPKEQAQPATERLRSDKHDRELVMQMQQASQMLDQEA